MSALLVYVDMLFMRTMQWLTAHFKRKPLIHHIIVPYILCYLSNWIEIISFVAVTYTVIRYLLLLLGLKQGDNKFLMWGYFYIFRKLKEKNSLPLCEPLG